MTHGARSAAAAGAVTSALARGAVATFALSALFLFVRVADKMDGLDMQRGHHGATASPFAGVTVLLPSNPPRHLLEMVGINVPGRHVD